MFSKVRQPLCLLLSVILITAIILTPISNSPWYLRNIYAQEIQTNETSIALQSNATSAILTNSTFVKLLINGTSVIIPINATSFVPINATFVKVLVNGTYIILPINATFFVPTNVTAAIPTNVTEAIPTNVTAAIPTNVTAAIPTNVTAAIPTNVTAAIPTNVTEAIQTISQPNISLQFNDLNSTGTMVLGDASIQQGLNQGSLKLEESGSYVQVPSEGQLSLELTALTLSAWVKPDYTGGSAEFTVISKPKAFSLTINNNIYPYKIAKFSVFDGISWQTIESESTIGEEWTHLAATFDGDKISIYVNGKLDGTLELVSPLIISITGQVEQKSIGSILSDYDVMIGADFNARAGTPNVVKDQYAGLIDDVQIRESLLDQSQILALYNQEIISHVRDDSVKTKDVSSFTLEHEPIEIGKPVTWTENVTLSKESEQIAIELPADAQNVTAEKPSGEDLGILQVTTPSSVLGNESSTLVSLGESPEMLQVEKPTKLVAIDEAAQELSIQFETPAPYAIEEDHSTEELYNKEVKVGSNSTLHYTDVKSYSDIPEDLVELGVPFRLNLLVDGVITDVTDDPAYEVEFIDTDGNGIVDQIQWVVPQLSEKTFFVTGIIEISKAVHLDSNRKFIEDIYDQVKERDGIFVTIPAGDYIRVKFETSLTNENDITLYAKSEYPDNNVEVYKKKDDALITDFGSITEDAKYRVLLTNLSGTEKFFDLKIVGNPVEFDHIIDPSQSSGAKFPTTNAAHTTGLTNPTNAYADDGVYATAAPAKNAGISTDYGTFGFDSTIPSGATINSVKITYEYKVSTTTSIATARVNSIVSGTHDANHDDTSEPTSDTVKIVDVTADRSWTRANLLDGTFKVHLEGIRGGSNTAVTFSFDYIKVEVTYTIVPVISSVSFSPTSGTSKIGDAITMTINSDGTGYTAGTITVNGKATTGFASAGGNNYQVTYTVASGDNDIADSATIPVSVVLTNTAGDSNAAFTTSPTAANSPAIDAHAPTFTVTSVSPTSGNTAKVGGTVVVTLTAGGSEATLTASGTQTVNGVTSTFANSGGGVYTITYTVVEGNTDISDSDALPVSITLQDIAGNPGTTITSIASGTAPGIDAHAPTVVLSSAAANPTNSSPFSVTATFSESVTGFVVGDITVGNGAAGNFVAVSGTVYTFDVTPTANGAVTVDIAAGVAADTATNSNTIATQLSRTFDGTAPTFTAARTGTNTIVLTFSENVDTTTTAGEGYTLSTGTVTANTDPAGSSNSMTLTTSGVAGTSATPTVTYGTAAGTTVDAATNEVANGANAVASDGVAPTFTAARTGTNTIVLTFSENVDTTTTAGEGYTLSTGTVTANTDPAGSSNSMTLTTSGVAGTSATPTVTYGTAAGTTVDAATNEVANGANAVASDGVAPTVVLSSAAANPTNSSPFSVTATFSESVTGFVVGDITVGNGAAGNFVAVSGTVYTFDVTPTANGAVTIDIAAGVAADTATNSNTIATQLSRTFDTTAPTTTASPAGGLYNTAQSVTLSANEAATIYYTTDGTTPTTSSTQYTTAISISTTTTLKFFAKDTAANSEAVKTETYTFDTTPPTFTTQYYSDSALTTSLGNNPKLKAGTYYIKITSSEALSGTPTISIAAEGTANDVTNAATTSVSGNDYKYTRTIATDAAAVGSVLEDLSVTGTDSASNTATNANPTNEATSAAYTDTTAPTVVLSSAAANPTNSSPFSVTATFSESVTGFVVGDITVGNGAAGNFVAVSGTVYTFDVTPTANGAVTVDIAAGVAADAATNSNTIATQLSRTFDTTAPTTTASPAGGLYNTAQSVTLSANEAATIYYTTDGTTPTTSSTQYTTAISISTTTTLKFFAKDTAANSEAVKTETYTVDTVAPITTVTGATDGNSNAVAPGGSTNSNSISIAFIADGTGSAVTLSECKLDSGAFAECTSPKSYSSLADASHTVQIRSTDAAGNLESTASYTWTVDTTAPTITLTGASPQTIELGSAYTELGATVSDNQVAAITATINSAAVNTAAVGSYSVTYNAVDTAGNTATQVTRTVDVVDTTAPVITLTGASPQTIELGSAYTELGATVSDNQVAAITATINSAAVNTGLVGSYSVTYNAVDTAGNTATQVTRTVDVVDTTAPVITLTGASPQTIELGSAYTELGATVSDNQVAAITATINSAAVNTAAVGSYSVTYNAVDTAGNTATQVTRTVDVVDTTPPTITVPADVSAEATGAQTAVTLGTATATDLADDTVSVTNNAPATFPVGPTTVTYTASDSHENTATATQTVTITDTTKPTITLNESTEVWVSKDSTYDDAGATALDLVDVTVTVHSISTVNTGEVGSYTVTYDATDAAGNTAVQVTRTVNVVDANSIMMALAAPTLSITSLNTLSGYVFAMINTDEFRASSTELPSIIIAGNSNSEAIYDAIASQSTMQIDDSFPSQTTGSEVIEALMMPEYTMPDSNDVTVILPPVVTEENATSGQVVATPPLDRIVPGQQMMIPVNPDALASFGGITLVSITSSTSPTGNENPGQEWFVMNINDKIPAGSNLPSLSDSGIDERLSLFIQVKYPFAETGSGFNWGIASNFETAPTLTLVVPKPTADAGVQTDSNGCQQSNIYILDETVSPPSWTTNDVSIISQTESSPGASTCDVLVQVAHFSDFTLSGIPILVPLVIGGENPTSPPSVSGLSVSTPQTREGQQGFGARLDLDPNKVYTNVIETGDPTKLRLRLSDEHGTSVIEHIALYTNLSGVTRDIVSSDTYIIWDKNKPFEVVDPHGLFSKAEGKTSTIGRNLQLTLDFTFKQPMEKSDIIIRAWDQSKNSRDIRFHDALQIVNPQIIPGTQIPVWVKNNAEWWSEGKIGDSDFVEGVQYLIKNEIIKVPSTTKAGEVSTTQIPAWVKSNAQWWAEGLISEKDFVTAIQWLISNGIISLPASQ